MIYRSLEDKLQAVGNPAKMARQSPAGPFLNYRVPGECSNWREEQTAWRETAALLDLTHHMTDLTVEGPDAIRLFSDLGVNSFKSFAPGKAKQFVCCNSDGYVIGDGILFYLAHGRLSLLGLPAAHNWVQFHAQSGRYDVKVDREAPTLGNPTAKRKQYRYQVQGPRALDILRKASAGTLPDIKFFNIGEFTIAGRPVRALRHGMAGTQGLELFGPWDDGNDVRAAILDAGQEFGLRSVGMKAYPTTTLESGWIPGPLPAVFTGDELKAYRQWLPGNGLEAVGSLGGSYVSDDIRDYYSTPYELGYGSFVKFDHEFIGRAALEAKTTQLRRKVTLAWNTDDVAAAMRTLFEPGRPAKYIDLPWSSYAMWQYDKVLENGKLVGLSTRCGYSHNERSMLSLAVLNADIEIGAEVTLIWGEDNRDSRRLVVEPHVQTEIRTIVSPCPYAEVTRTSYVQGWRSRATAEPKRGLEGVRAD